MKTVDPEDRDLIDLYHNEGGADPLLVACALAAKEESDGGLFALEWTIVTNDKAVTALASKFGVDTLSVSEFADLIDSFDDK